MQAGARTLAESPSGRPAQLLRHRKIAASATTSICHMNCSRNPNVPSYVCGPRAQRSASAWPAALQARPHLGMRGRQHVLLHAADQRIVDLISVRPRESRPRSLHAQARQRTHGSGKDISSGRIRRFMLGAHCASSCWNFFSSDTCSAAAKRAPGAKSRRASSSSAPRMGCGGRQRAPA